MLLALMLSILFPVVGEHKQQTQLFKYESRDTHTEDGKPYDTFEPYLPFRLGVIQTEGAKHKSKDLVKCWPDTPEGSKIMEMACDDGSRWMVVGIEFPTR